MIRELFTLTFLKAGKSNGINDFLQTKVFSFHKYFYSFQPKHSSTKVERLFQILLTER